MEGEREKRAEQKRGMRAAKDKEKYGGERLLLNSTPALGGEKKKSRESEFT